MQRFSSVAIELITVYLTDQLVLYPMIEQV